MPARLVFSFVVALQALALAASPAMAEARVALVIGNARYATGALANPRNDAELMARTLQGVGFKVKTLLDADQITMKRAMVEFGRELRDSDTVGLFYYAGHGVQVDGENYLVPVGADIRDAREVAVEGVAASEFLKIMQRSPNRINIAIFDACRNNPFGSLSRSASRGLARVDAPAGTIIAYATAPGDVALDGTGENSPYTLALADAMATSGITIEDAFKRARRQVLASTGEKQTPWESSSLTGDFYFKPGPRVAPDNPGGSLDPSAPEDERLVELKAYDAIKDSDDVAALRAFLERFPDGVLAAVVKQKLDALSGGAATPGAGEAAGPVDPASPEGMFRLAVRTELGDGAAADPEAAARLYRQAADKGHAGALAGLASLFERGAGVDKSDTDAARLYRRAAGLGSARALDSLALMLREGRGTPKDENEAFSLFEKAAGLNLPDAMAHLAEMHHKGRGTQRDMTEAVRWYSRAADKGHAGARATLATLLELGDGVPKDLRRAIELYQQAAEAGDAAGMTSLGYLYEQGKGVGQDAAKAAALYQRAAAAGDPRAAYNLAGMLREGRGVAVDPAQAAKLYRLAADKGFAAAKRGLAVLYDEGSGVPRDPKAAARLVLEAYRAGHKETREELARQPEAWSEATRREIQSTLRRDGFFKGRADGRFGPPTWTALQAWAKRN